ncbi:MAG: hypothetical protein WDN44_04170 [Sphingomonas sp.]
MRQNILIFGGILLVLFGALFLLQGLNAIHWPADSTMLGEKTWIVRGAVMIVVGAILVGGARLVPPKRRKGDIDEA